MKFRYAGIFILFALCAVVEPNHELRAQSIPDLVSELGIRELARDYLRPAADAVGYSFNSGLYHTARIDTGFSIWFGIKGVWTFIPDDQRTFTATIPAHLTQYGYPDRIVTATVAGGSGALLQSGRTDPSGKPYPDIRLPDGADLKNTFIVLPHVTIGSFAATELMLRGIPPITFDPEIGKISFFGAGLKHSPTQYIELPFDLAFMAAAQQFKIGRVMNVTNLAANVHASLPLGILEAFGGFGYESYSIKVAYEYTPDGSGLPPGLDAVQSISLDFERVNFRFTAGVNVTFIPLVDLTLEYCIGVQDNLTLGAGIRF